MDKLKLAYIVLVHRNADQVNLLLEQMLDDGDADIFIHIDRKCKDSIRSEIKQHKRIKLLNTQVSVFWGDISMIDATLLLFSEVVKTGKVYDYICLRSGQDLMVRKGFESFLLEHNGKNFIEVHNVNSKSSNASLVYCKWPKILRRRYGVMHPLRWFRSLAVRLFQLGFNLFPNKNILPSRIKLYRGSQWFCITYDLAKYIVQYLNENPWYYLAFGDSLISDEWFFHTLIMNSPFAYTVIKKNLTYIRMGETLSTHNHPLVITMKNVCDIDGTENFFARKFDPEIDYEVIDHYYKRIVCSGN